MEFTSETLTAVDIWSRLGESKGERLSLLERAEKLAKWSVKMAPDEVGGLQNLGAVLIDIGMCDIAYFWVTHLYPFS